MNRMNCWLFWIGKRLEKSFVDCDGCRIEVEGCDGCEFIGSFLVEDECVVVEGVDDVRDGQYFQSMIKGWGGSAVPGSLRADERRHRVDEGLFPVYGLQFQQGVLSEHWR